MEFFNSMEEKTNTNNIDVLLGNIYWQRKAAEAIAAQRIAEAELEAFKLANSHEGYFPLSENAKQALNNQTMFFYLVTDLSEQELSAINDIYSKEIEELQLKIKRKMLELSKKII